MTAADALARNDRYLQGVVEAFGLCPFARQCRTSGQLQRVVLTGEDVHVDLRAALLALQAADDDAFEVALVLLPRFVETSAAFETLLRAVEAEVATALAARGKAPTCFAVAFHPQLPFTVGQAHQLVGLLRRSPDPTVQLVRRSLLARVRGVHGEQRYVDIEGASDWNAILAAAATLAGDVPLSERIANHNLQTWIERGPALHAALEATAVR